MALRKGPTRPRAISRARSSGHIPILEVRDFPGTYSYPKPQQIPRGAAQSSMNFLTRSSWFETRGGYRPLGAESPAAGRALGIYTAHKWDGSEVVFVATKDGKLKYYDAVNDVFAEVGNNILAGAGVIGENVYMDEYFSPAGAQLWISSPSSDLIKIMTANPGSYVSQYDTNKNYKGRIIINQNAMSLWHYKTSTLSKGTNATHQRSYVDSQIYATQTDNALSIVIAGPLIRGTLTKAGNTKATVFGIQLAVVDGVTENFTDDYLGNLTGSAGGTGTINYATGAFSITPKQAPSAPVVSCVYSYEDSTNKGLADFTHSATRVAGEGVAHQQNNGGDIMAKATYNGSDYILHQRNAWVLTMSTDDSSAINVVYRKNISLPSERGAVATADGIFYVDTTITTRPYIALLTYSPISSQVLPVDLSSNILDLSGFAFDKLVAYEWGDFIVFACRTTDSTENNRMIIYNKKLSSSGRRIFDVVDYFANCLTTFKGQLVAGDSVSNNVYKLFDGFDDNGGIPVFSWTGNIDDHGMPGIKATKKQWIEGYIALNQSVDVYIQLDSGMAYKIGTISGKGKYVDVGQAVTIGSLQVGPYPIGGPSGAVAGYHYLRQIRINTAKYKYFTIKFLPTDIGYFSVQMYANYDIRRGIDKLPLKYRG